MDWNSLSNDSVMQEIGKRLKAQRISKKRTQQQLAEKAGVSLFTISQIEKGNSVSMNMLIPVLRVLRLIDNMELLVPEPQISPIALLKQKQQFAKRVRSKKAE
jgi:transcriptional regulator with XRE-family HTH domain